MTIKQPPHINGEMVLTDIEIKAITEALVLIRESFEETDEQSVCDTFYLTATYNRENTFKINGDTCQALLSEYDNPAEETAPIEEV